jgi:polysaccharide biosynthesis/export protein
MYKFAVLLPLFTMTVLTPICAQTKVQGASQLTLPEPPPTQGAPRSFSGDALATPITGARVALGSGDLLEIGVFDTPELSQKVRVNIDGKIVLPLIGEVSVQGLSPDLVEKSIRTRLIAGHFVRDPQVSVFVAEYAGQMAYITGEVNRPGAYPLLRLHHLADLIAVAGGLSARASNTVTITHQGDTASSEVDLADKNEKQRSPEILAGDSIIVGQTGIIYVLGDVTRPGGFLLDRRTTLSVVQAVALAEGTTTTASVRKAQLIRATDGVHQMIPIDLKTILKSESPDPLMQPGDILYVPQSLTRGMGRLSIQTILATISGVAIYSSYHF